MAASHPLETLKAVDGKNHTLRFTAHSDFKTHGKTLSSVFCILFVLGVTAIALFADVINQ